MSAAIAISFSNAEMVASSASNEPLVATIALATTLVWLVLDSGEGLINSIEDGEPTPSFLTTVPFLMLTLFALCGKKAREEIEEVCAA